MMCDFDCFNCKFPDCIADYDEIDIYIRYKRKHGRDIALLIVKKYIELKEERNDKKRPSKRSKNIKICN